MGDRWTRTAATEKAKRILSAQIHRLPFNEPLEPIEVPVNHDVLVVGGGIAGIEAALKLSATGKHVTLVERNPSIGGHMAMFDKTFPTLDCAACILTPKMSALGKDPNITLMAYSEVEEVDGYVGNFTVKVRKKARYVNTDTCTGCGACQEACVVRKVRASSTRASASAAPSTSRSRRRCRCAPRSTRPSASRSPRASASSSPACRPAARAPSTSSRRTRSSSSTSAPSSWPPASSSGTRRRRRATATAASTTSSRASSSSASPTPPARPAARSSARTARRPSRSPSCTASAAATRTTRSSARACAACTRSSSRT